MKKTTLLVVIMLLAFTPVLNAQVGIGTTNPKALLHIVAPPGTSIEESGIILPKVSALPTDNLEGKKGMFLYLDSNDTAEGIYFYNGEKWKKNDNAWRLGGNKIEDGEFIGTTNQKDLNFKVDNKQRLKIGVGGEFILRVPNGNELINIDKDANYTISNNNGHKLIEFTRDGNYTINNGNGEKLIDLTKDGVITLPHTDIIKINDEKSIATKEYVDSNTTDDQTAAEVPYDNTTSGLTATDVQVAIDELNTTVSSNSGGVLEEITEGLYPGYRIKASTNAANYGNIGSYATDLSYSDSASFTRGATGPYSFATGFFTTASGEQSFAAGNGATASGARAFALGNGAKASGNQSFATGSSTTASGGQSFATGSSTTASGGHSFAAGNNNIASGTSSFAAGANNRVVGTTSAVFGFGNFVQGNYSFAAGYDNIASGVDSFAMGRNNDATGNGAFAMGRDTNATGHGSATFGYFNTASSDYAFATGNYNTASGYASFAAGRNNHASGFDSFVSGKNNISRSYCEVVFGAYATDHDTGVDSGTMNAANRQFAVGNGSSTTARADAFEVFYNGTIYADGLDVAEITDNKQLVTKEYVDANGGGVLEEITEGGSTGYRINGSTNAANYGNTGDLAVDLSHSSSASSTKGATGHYSFSAGTNNTASGMGSVAQGALTVASGEFSFASGYENTASGDYSIAMGQQSNATGSYAIAMGRGNTASNFYSIAMGLSNNATVRSSIAMGEDCDATAFASVAMGGANTASGATSLATGNNTFANSYSEVSMGHFNTNVTAASTNGVNTSDRILSVGIGTGTGARADGFEIFKDGTIYADQLNINEIKDPNQLVTKEYVDDKVSAASGGGENSITVESSSTSISIQSDKSRETFIMTGGTPDIDTISVPTDDSVVDGKIITIIRPNGGNDIRLNQGGNIELLYDDVKLSQNINNSGSIDYKSSITLVYSAEQDKWYVLSAY